MSTEESPAPQQPLQKAWYHYLDPLLRGPTPPVPEQREVCPEATAGLLARLSFSWMTDIMVVGRRRAIEMSDIWLISPERSIERLTDRFYEALQARDQRGKTAHRLLLTMHDVFKRDFWTGAFWLLTTCLCQAFIPFALRYLLNYLTSAYNYANGIDSTDGEPSIKHGIGYVMAMLVMQLLQSVSTNQYIYYGFMNGAQARALLISVLFGKSLDLSLEARAGTPAKDDGSSGGGGGDDACEGYSSSRLLTMMTSDVARIDMAAGLFHIIWTAPVQILLTLVLLLINLGWAAVAGFALLFVGVAALTYALKMLVGRRRAINAVTDDRNARTLEVLEAIGAVKYGGMDGPLLARLAALRNAEVELVTALNIVRNALNAFSIALPLFGAGITFAVYAKTGNTLSAAPIFSSLALFMSLRQPFNLLPRVIGQVADAWSSFRRLELLFAAGEFSDYVAWESDEKDAVRVQQATFAWAGVPDEASSEKPLDDFVLENIDLAVRPGELLAVVGSVGSGKSSLLSALAGGMRKVKGQVNIGTGSRAYCPQQAWIRTATLRENIVFDRPFDAERYARVVACCCLGPDIDSLPAGDRTEVGERGATLSGGQQQRVNLARTLYSDAGLVLLDDPLSAVDAHVGTRIFEGAICGYLQGRTRILSTHQLHILSSCDRVLWLDGGRIKALATFAELHAHDAEFRALVASHQQRAAPKTSKKAAEEVPDAKAATEALLAPGSGTLAKDEDITQGDMSWGLLASYVRGSGSALFGIIPLVFLVFAQGSNTLTSVWLSMWTAYRFDMSTDMYIGVLISIATTQTLFFFLFGTAVSVLCGRASRRLVNKAIEQVVHATMAFHDTTPLGRIVNRLSRDVELVDNQLPESIRMFAYTVAIVASVVVLICAYIKWFVIAIPPLVAVILYAATYYMASATQFKRFEATLRGVVYARVSEAISGFDAIRTYAVRGPTTQRLYRALNDMSSAYFLTLSNQRWVATRLDLVAVTMVIVVNLLAVFLRDSLDPSTSGMLLSYSMAVTQMMQLVIRQLSEVENSMVSVEKLTEYATALPQEAPPPPEGSVHIPPAWPDRGHITLQGVQARYRPGLPNALNGIDLTIEGGQKVAVVGRTGAGKSSIAASLFRLVELSGGSITIDGIDIARMPLSELRSRLSIIPQEPKMFRGTLRANLDPFDESTDADIWDVVRRVQLRGEVSGTDGGNYLDMAVEEYGSNFSKGQRQLISVARALLRQSSIVVCDEATSSIDLNTDQRIQKIMMEAFAGRTVITIAHRLQTIVGYDLVCVMDHGHVAEQGPPYELWQKPESIFRSLCDKDGIQNHHFFQ